MDRILRRRILFATLLATFIVAFTPAYADDAPETPVVEIDILIPVDYAELGENGWSGLLDVGLDDGVVIGGRRTVFRADRETGLQRIGEATMQAVVDTVTLITFLPDDGDTLRIADLVEMRLERPRPEGDPLSWRLARKCVVLSDVNGEVLFSYRDILGEAGGDADGPLFSRCAAGVRALAGLLTETDFPDLFVPLEEGRWTGRTVHEAMSNASADDVRLFLLYMVTYPGRYAGQSWTFEELFATWALNGAPESSLETLDAVRALEPDAARAYIADRRDWAIDLMIMDEWYTEATRHAAEGREDELSAVLDAMALLAETVDIPYFRDLYWGRRASYHQDREEWDEAVAAWRASAEAAEKGSRSEAISRNNLGNALRGAGRHEEAVAAYAASLAYYGALTDTLADPDAAESWRGTGLAYAALGRVDEAARAYEAAAELFARRGGLSDLQRRYGALSELGDVYDGVGRNREAIDAWRRGLVTANELGWESTVASALDDMSDGFRNMGDLQTAVDLRLEAIAIHERLGEDYSTAVANTNLASIYWDLGRSDEADACYTAALAVHEAREEWWDVADVLERRGSNERRKGAYGTALTHLHRARELYTRDGWTRDLGECLLEIAECHEGLGRTAVADSVYTLALATQRGAGNPIGEAKTLQWWGYSLFNRKAVDDARDKLDAALALSRETGDLEAQTDIWRTLAVIFTSLEGAHEQGLDAAHQALEIARAMPSKPKEAQALAQLAQGWFNAGDIDAAFEAIAGALELFRETQDVSGLVDGLTTMGRLHAARGDYDEAMASYGLAMEAAEAADLDGGVANVLSATAWQHHVNGDQERAVADAERAQAIYVEQGNTWAAGGLYNTLGSARSSQGLYDEALRLHELSLAACRKWNDPYGSAAAHNNLGEVLRSLGDCEAAVAHFESALEIGERIRWLDVLTITAGNLAKCLQELDRPDEALGLIDRALRLAREERSTPRIADMLYYRGDLLYEFERLDEAAEALAEGLETAGAMGDAMITLTLASKLAAVDWKRGRLDAAADRLDALLPRLEAARNPNMLWEPLFTRARVRRDRGETGPAVDTFRAAIDALESVRTSMTDASAATGFQEEHSDVYRELADLYMLLGREEEAFEIIGLMKSDEAREMGVGAGPRLEVEEQALVDEAESLRSDEARLVRLLRDELARPADRQRAELIGAWQAEIDSLKLRFMDFTSGLRDAHPEAYARLEVSPVTFNQLRRGLHETEAFLEPVVLPDRVVVFVVRGGDEPLVYRETPAPESLVDGLIRDMRAGLEHPDGDWETARAARLAGRPMPEATVDPSVPARKLHALLIAPLAGDLVGVETLIVSPSGRLRYIPFAALYDGERYLLDRYEVSVLTQAGTLTSRRPVAPDASLLAFGNPDGTLAGAEAEVADLEEIWSPAPVDAFYGADATKDRLRLEAGGHDILHLATHGVLLNDRPEASYLVLAGDDPADRLTFRDIVLLDLYETDLTVLSACETAVGDHGEGKEIAGLAYNFEQTGAAAVIASLWMVNDAGTSQLMTGLYRNLRGGETSKAGALRAAQLALRNSDDYAHPYYWAPFILIGNWR